MAKPMRSSKVSMWTLAACFVACVATRSGAPVKGHPHLRQLQVACFKHWTRIQGGTSGTQSFTGVTNSTGKETYNSPLYYSVTAAQRGFTSSNAAKGRFGGSLPTTTYIGPMTFDFFAGKDQIKMTFTKATGRGTITSGKGCYAGMTGTATRKQIGTTLPKVFEWTFCPRKAPTCTAK